MAGRF
jgi:hypothetical protein